MTNQKNESDANVGARGDLRQILVDALQEAWDDHCADTGCYPDFLEIERGGKANANFKHGNFADYVAAKLNNEDTPWPLPDVVRKLADAADILLNQYDYDGHGYEQIEECVKQARLYAARGAA